MHRRPTRRLGVAAAAASAGLALALLPVSPASALTAPDWPASRVPLGCPITTLAETAGGFQLTYTDTTPVTITGWTFNGSTRRVVLKPGTNATTFRITASQPCSGVAGVLPILRQSINGAPPGTPSGLSIEQISTNAFDAVFGLNGTATSSTTGWLELPLIGTAQRYSSFVLDQDFALVSKVDSATTTWTTGTWSQQRVYIVLSSAQVSSASKTSVAKGGSVTFGTTVKVAGPSTYLPAAGVSVKLQTKLPGKPWVTRATKTTTSTGRASYTFKPGATQQWRWVLAENITTSPYWASSTSIVKTIKVT